MEYSVSTLKANTIQAATGTTVNVASGQVLNAPGHVLQVQSTTKTDQTDIAVNINSGYASYPVIMSVNITPKLVNSKILINYFISGSSDQNNHMVSTIRRTVGGTATHPCLADSATGFYQASTGTRGVGTNHFTITQQGFQFLDSPNTTSTITYAIVGASEAANTWHINSNGNNSGSYDWSTRFTSSVTVMEIAQ